MKNLTEVTTTSTLQARFKDIVIDENEPRCFTSNASNPNEWHDGLPADVFITSAAVRVGYTAGIKAVFKRTVFAHVQSSIISEAMRTGYAIKRRRPDMGASSSSAASVFVVQLSLGACLCTCCFVLLLVSRLQAGEM